MIDRRTFSATLIAGVATSLFVRSTKAQVNLRSVPAMSSWSMVHMRTFCWSEVIGRLQPAGLNATAVQNPLTSLADDVAATRRILALQTGRRCSVGHSWAGTVISEAGLIPKSLPLSRRCSRPGRRGDYTALAAKFPRRGQCRPSQVGRLRQLSEERSSGFRCDIEPLRHASSTPVQGRVSDTLFFGKTTQAAWWSKLSWYASPGRQDDLARAGALHGRSDEGQDDRG